MAIKRNEDGLEQNNEKRYQTKEMKRRTTWNEARQMKQTKLYFRFCLQLKGVLHAHFDITLCFTENKPLLQAITIFLE